MVIPITVYADDFQIEIECNSGDVTINVKNQDGDAVSNAKVMTINGISRNSSYEDKFFTDEKGQVKIFQLDNTGFVWLQKGGFNDQKTALHCSENEIPAWVKNNAKWWVDGQIPEESFLDGMRFLIQNDIMKIPSISKITTTSTIYEPGAKIPEWIGETVGWWANDAIDDDTFVQGMQFLVMDGILDVREKPKHSGDSFAVDSNLPTLETFGKFDIKKPDWKFVIQPVDECEKKVGVKSSKQISATKAIYNERTGEYDEFTSISSNICQFDKESNSQRAWTGSTNTDIELMQTSVANGYSEHSGDCFITGKSFSRSFNEVSAGCTYGTHTFGVTWYSTEPINDDASDLLISLMDDMLKKSNKMRNIDFETSFFQIVGFESEQLTTEITSVTSNFVETASRIDSTECPSDYPYRWSDGNCWNVSEDYEIKLECTQDYPFMWSNGQCYNLPECSGEYQYRWSDGQCYNLPECSGEYQYRWSDNQCYNAPECSGEYQYRWSDGNCYNMRECTGNTPYRWSDNRCYNLPECTVNFPYRWDDGQCYNQPPPPQCNAGSYDTGYGYCCPDDMYTTGDGMCNFIEACPAGYWETNSGYCCPDGTFDPGDGTCRYP